MKGISELFLGSVIRKVHVLLAWKVYGEVLNQRELTVRCKTKLAPNALVRPDILTAEILGSLVVLHLRIALCHTDRNHVGPLVNVLVHILDSRYNSAYLNINMRAITVAKERVVRDNPVIAERILPAANPLGMLSDIAAPVCWVAALVHNRAFLERLREAFRTLPVIHTDSMRVGSAARVIEHVRYDNLVEAARRVHRWRRQYREELITGVV